MVKKWSLLWFANGGVFFTAFAYMSYSLWMATVEQSLQPFYKLLAIFSLIPGILALGVFSWIGIKEWAKPKPK